MSVVDIKTKAQFDELLKSSSLVSLQAHAEWCGPCKAISPFFEKHATAAAIPDKYTFARFDIEEVPDLSQELGIKSIPAFFFFENGTLEENIVGTKPADLKKAVDGFAAKAKGDSVSA